VVWIISGPTSVGKSTFIASARGREITKIPADAPIIIPGQDGRLPTDEATDCYYHYNILRPASLLWRKQPEADLRGIRFDDDRKWLELVASKRPKKAIVLVADKGTIVERARGRTIRESEFPSRAGHPYDPERWLPLLNKVDLAEIYRAWCAELDHHSIPRILIDSSNQHFKILESLS
jgi:hypothetical protein